METRYRKRLGMSFSLRRRRLRIYRATIDALGEPERIRFLINKKSKQLAIEACRPFDRESFQVPYPKEGQTFCFELCLGRFLRELYAMSGWDPAKTYRAFGVYHPDHNVSVYSMTEAEAITQEEDIDPDVEVR